MRDWRKALLLGPLVLGLAAYVVFVFQGSVLRALRGDRAELDAYEQLCVARGGPLTAPRTPAQHLRMTGRARFGDGAEAVEQDAELLLGGAARMRFRLSADGARNVFALSDADCWLLAAGSETWRDYEPQPLDAETRLRWELARFPWDWPRPLEAARLPGLDADADGTYARDDAHGRLLVEVVDGRPTRLRLLAPGAADDAAPLAELRVEEWAAPGDGVRAQPRTLHWPGGARRETWERVEDRAFFLDETFRPPQPGVAGELARPDLAEQALDLGDRVALRVETVAWLSSADLLAVTEEQRPAGHAWRCGEEYRLVPGAAAEALAPATQALLHQSNARWLVWSRYASEVDAARDRADLDALLAQAGVRADGPAWELVVPEDGRRRLRVLRVPVVDA